MVHLLKPTSCPQLLDFSLNYKKRHIKCTLKTHIKNILNNNYIFWTKVVELDKFEVRIYIIFILNKGCRIWCKTSLTSFGSLTSIVHWFEIYTWKLKSSVAPIIKIIFSHRFYIFTKDNRIWGFFFERLNFIKIVFEYINNRVKLRAN
jgi:hypothetical protein